ncbi:hypothetical protein DFR71_3254 [Nocardia alba]|uniref:Uncharacterized protein n=1 Tax=Nocardia alba TaxID=225051 RepID=A0A4R1FR69_9NOCA|nr:hypothetical protein DFR71_3254 [Nocardia alba]
MLPDFRGYSCHCRTCGVVTPSTKRRDSLDLYFRMSLLAASAAGAQLSVALKSSGETDSRNSLNFSTSSSRSSGITKPASASTGSSA